MRYDYLLYERYSMESRKCFLFSFFIYLTHSSYYYYSDLHGYVMQGCLSACLYTLCTIYILSACMFGLSCCTFCPMLSIDVLLQTKSPLGDNKKLYLLTYLKYTNNCIVIMINMSGPLRLHVYKQTGKHTQTRKLCAAL